MGNDILVIDPRDVGVNLTASNVRRICDRHFGIGADGICYGPLPSRRPFEMQYYNPDGSQAEKSGNGLRVFARYLRDSGYVDGPEFDVSIGGHVCRAEFIDNQNSRIRIDMGSASFQTRVIPAAYDSAKMIDQPLQVDGSQHQVTCVNIGNPHCVLFIKEIDVNEVIRLGARFECHTVFPKRINVQWVVVKGKHRIGIEIWERGAGYTLSSGSSAAATACAAIVNGFCRSPVEVEMAGGVATVEVDRDWYVRLTGEVQAIASGSFAQEFITRLE